MSPNVFTLPLEIRFLCQLARRLHEYGAAAYRIEGAIDAASRKLRYDCHVFSNPTSILLSFTPSGAGDEVTIPSQLIRLAPGDIDLGKLRFVDDVAEQVSDGKMSIAEGYHLLKDADALNRQPAAWPQILAWAGVAGAVTVLLGGGAQSIIAALIVGLIVAIAQFSVGSKLSEHGGWEAVAAFIAAFVTHLLAMVLPISEPVVALAAILVIVPGLGLTIGVSELTQRHLVSGTARFSGAIVVLLQLAFGVVLGEAAATALVGDSNLTTGISLPPWSIWPALLVSSFAFAILFRVDRRDVPAAMLAAIISFSVARFSGAFVDGHLNVFVAALVIAALSNAHARWTNRPAMITRLPGIIGLVPGSLGYKTINLMFAHDALASVEMTADLMLILACLVGGLAIGNSIVPPRRNL